MHLSNPCKYRNDLEWIYLQQLKTVVSHNFMNHMTAQTCLKGPHCTTWADHIGGRPYSVLYGKSAAFTSYIQDNFNLNFTELIVHGWETNLLTVVFILSTMYNFNNVALKHLYAKFWTDFTLHKWKIRTWIWNIWELRQWQRGIHILKAYDIAKS